MPSLSIAQRHLFAAADHGADFPMARKLRATTTHAQRHDFAATSEKNLPGHVKKKKRKATGTATTLGRMYGK